MAASGTLLSCVRRLHCSVSALAGSQWRLQAWLPILPATGPSRSSQTGLTRRRVVLLSQEMDAGIQAWQLRQQKLQEEERKQKNALKRKGASLQSSLPCP
uniref:39S ribosomal protein L52, mitochondrial isoform X4 n=1 Tax=Urocitellus parryii TaxID=9999 RepID=UPI000E55AF81|nr:39S ribosomal protein L52, mitochondrial isoform X4 [Urocitellus parryii]